MTNKFREALEEVDMQMNNYSKPVAGIELDEDYDRDIIETIRQALLIAERLESGEVSKGMYQAHCDMLSSNKPNWIKEQFKAMAKVMIEEVEGEK